ncbi:MFS transporter [Bacillus sp. FJAT-45350]|uniref:MFS transporter n=1 Tax=Bacillus sp. FJAT-45350 TaxID=2011014 RepID=UPI000BB8F8E6|nr:MFS transporter [Bacillus sp. FJAT-45350]
MSKQIHKGWWILALIVLSVLAGLGFGRFAFGAILPFMKDGLFLDYRQTGFIASSIFFGYLFAVTIAGYFVIRYTAKKVIIFSLFLVSFSMVLTALAPGFLVAYIGCFLIGVGTGGAYVPSLGLVGQWFSPKKRGMAMGTAMAGAGLGMVLSGFSVPAIVSTFGVDGWKISWYLLAIFVFTVAIINIFLLKNRPEDLNLSPIGGETTTPNKPNNKEQEPTKESASSVYRNKTLWIIGFIYMFWGMSYLIFSTFIVDYLIADVNMQPSLAGTYFAVGGAASIISGFIWGSVSDRIGRSTALSMVFLVQFVMLTGLTFTTDHLLILGLILIYGVTLWGVPAIMNASVGDYIMPKYIPVAMGFVTIFFSAGQFISPMVTGYLIEYTNSYLTAFLFSSFTCLLCTLGSFSLHLKQKKQNTNVEVSA